MRHFSLSLLALLLSSAAFAQAPAPIERVKITDNELGCKAAFDELQGLDKVIAETRAAQSAGQTTATAGQAAGVAAEVASRTGLFGSIGGLTGHIFGTVASKTAANVAEQQGQMSAAQAVEREKQALARKEHLTQIFLAKGCSASDPSAPGKTPATVAPAPAAAASPLSAGEASAETLAGKRATSLAVTVEAINPEDLQSSKNVLLIPTAYVSLVTEGRVSAPRQSGAFQ